MEEVIELAGRYQGAITALATVIIAFAAVVTTRLTAHLAKENRLLRKAGTEPEVVAYLMTDRRYSNAVNFVLANIGQGAARNVQFTFEADDKDFSFHDVRIANTADRKAISVLPPGDRVEAFLGTGPDLFKEPVLAPFKVSVQYENMTGRCRRGAYQLDVSQFAGLIQLGSPAEHEVAEAIKKIETHLRSVITGGLKWLKVETSTTAKLQKKKKAQLKKARETAKSQKRKKQPTTSA